MSRSIRSDSSTAVLSRAPARTDLGKPCLIALLLVGACGGESVPEVETPAPPPAATALSVPKGSFARADVVRVVDAGLGNFLQRVRVEPMIEEGRFAGFRVLELVPESDWRDIDLRVGDVVTHVNERSVEDPNQAYEVFESLRTASELRVQLRREGTRRELRFPIVGAPAPKSDTGTQGE